MTEILAGALGGLLTLAAAVTAVAIWWSVQDRRVDRVLSELSHLS